MKRIRLIDAKAGKQTETANAASSELGPLVCYTAAQVFTKPPSWTVPSTDACNNGDPHAHCATSTQSRLQRCSICPMQEGWPSDWIRLRFSIDGCNIFYVTRGVRGDSPSMRYNQSGCGMPETRSRHPPAQDHAGKRPRTIRKCQGTLRISSAARHVVCAGDPAPERPSIYTT